MNPTESLSFSRMKMATRGAFWLAFFAIGVATAVGYGMSGVAAAVNDEAKAFSSAAWQIVRSSDQPASDQVRQLSRRIADLESALELHKTLGECWDQAAMDVQTRQRIDLIAIENKVDELARKVPQAGDVVISLSWDGMPQVTMCGAEPSTEHVIGRSSVTSSVIETLSVPSADTVWSQPIPDGDQIPHFNACEMDGVCWK